MALRLYNSLTRELEEFKPINSDHVGLYTCGPTVYDYVTIGNWRTYTLGDIIARTLAYNNYKVDYYMNITDVGHLTGDNEGDADTGEDRMEKAKKREGKTAWDVAAFYAKDFEEWYRKMHLTHPEKFTKATEYIKEQIALVEKLEKNGVTYRIDDGIYFDTVSYEAKGFVYGELSNLDHIKAGARVEFNPQKKNPRDFALWKFSPKGEKRDMEWESPWGVGFPGWHIECSAMSMKYLGEQFDIHVGGEDLKSTHHPNEIAQSQGATGKAPFVKYWLHGAFLQVDGGRMGKSLGNAYNLMDLAKKGFSPMALRYFYMTGHYRSPLNFTWDSLKAAHAGYIGLLTRYIYLGDGAVSSHDISNEYKNEFLSVINNDLNMPQALAVVYKLLGDQKISPTVKKATLLDFDTVLGFGLIELDKRKIPSEITEKIKLLDQARSNKDYSTSDKIRGELEALGYAVYTNPEGTMILPKNL